MKRIGFAVSLLMVLISLETGDVNAAVMNDYCVTPPFIQESILPNLLLLIDNSASMYDLAYSDKGRKLCSVSGTDCTVSGSCPSGETCSFTNGRQPYYCYDQTYTTAKTYVGYFDSSKLYVYDFVADDFVESAAVFSCTAGAGETAKSVSGQLCVIYSAANIATTFKASGNYLNWLTGSKFDVQKEILTGGKYNGTQLLAESRGCVGNSFIKEANTANFVNYNSPETNNTNTSLDISFGVRGPYDSVNPSAPSQGGQSYVDIYKGNYNQGNCQAAMTAIVSGGNADIKTAVSSCLASASETTAVTKTKVVFQQSMQACWQKREGHAIAGDDINTVKNQCSDVYSTYATCSNDPKIVCTTATVATDCGAGNTCNYGPPAIVPGNSALLCSNEYEGQYYYYQGAVAAGTCSYDGTACVSDANCLPATYKQCKKTDNVCTTDADCPGSGNSCFKTITNTCAVGGVAVAAGWKLIPGVTEAQMIATHEQFCTDMSAPTVIDPTDAPAANPDLDSVPAILSGVGLDAQLNQPIGTLAVKLRKATAPNGVISDFSSQVRIGAMTFNFAGSAAEATSGALAAPKLCSNDSTKVCTLDLDCVSPGTCNATTAGTSNFDGGKIIHYVGTGHCSTTTATVCYNDANCPSGEHCISDGVGTYSSGLVKAVNDIKAQAWTPFAEAFYNAMGYFAKVPATGLSRADLRLNTADFDVNRNPSQYRCQSDNVLLISDGMSTADRNTSVDDLAKLYTAAGGSTSWTVGGCPSYAGSVNLDNLAWIARNRNINTLSKATASTATPQESNESITTYVVFNGDSNGQAGECDSRTLLSQTAVNGGTSLYQAIDPAALDTALRDAFRAIAAGSASGTAASILSNSEGSGATLLQALFYPKKEFDKTVSTDVNASYANWIGELQSFWYYLDPFLQKTSIREDTNIDFKLSLKSDKVLQLYFDDQQKKTLVNKYTDANGDGAADSNTPDSGAAALSPDLIKSLWKAGENLWKRNLTTSPRTIYTGYNSTAGSTPQVFGTAAGFNTDTSTAVWNQLQIPDTTASPGITNAQRKALATKLINYVSGTDQADDAAPCLLTGCKYRGRKVTIQSQCAAGASDFTACTNEWKLGDIISSTPKLVSNIRVNNYNLTPPSGYNDASYGKFTTTTTYKNRGMAFVGANDGMLHAFKLGILKELNKPFDKAQITTAAGSTVASAIKAEIGHEAWAYIPGQALPYLKYLADPNYSHLYYVDRSPLIVDASIGRPAGCDADTNYSECTKSSDGSTWRTILVGGMGIGGASRELGASGSTVKAPIADVGYSSYFALDVTDPANPKHMWEFFGNTAASGETPTPMLGFATTGPAIVRVAAKIKNADNTYSTNPDHNKNAKWFAVFASGPQGPIDTVTHSFKGESDQNLRIFIVDLATGELLRTIDTELANAFAGSLASSTLDADRSKQDSSGYYSDDVVYVGYVQKDATVTPATWTKGGVLRITTKESTDPDDWVVSKLIDGVGPVTTSATKLQDRANKKLWVYFGTGRYYYKSDDSSTTQQALYGVKEPCYNTTANTLNKTCTATVDKDDITDQTGSGAAPASTLAATATGWKIVLDAKDDANAYLTERVITDPLAAPNGAVFFTTFKPSGDLCNYGGSSLLWAVRYDSGSTPPASAMQGKALMQVSTGAFAEIKLSDAFSNPDSTRYDGRRLATPITGVPPTAQGLSLFSNPPPAKKLLHVREK